MIAVYRVQYPPADTPYPLGRHVEHDPRSLEWPAPMVEGPLKTRAHRRYGSVFDQGDLGSCTGNAIAGAINTLPNHGKGDPLLLEADAVSLYELATVLDGFDGTYPPEDTGSSGLAACKAAKQKNLITGYWHAFGIAQALRSLQYRPVITGVNWYEQMFYPSEQGFVHPGGQIAGGHEFEVYGYVAARDPYVLCWNSWGTGWGPLGGRFKLFCDDWARLLSEDGDVSVPQRRKV